MAIVSSDYYLNTYRGDPAATADFSRFAAQAERAIAAITRYQVTEENIGNLPVWIQTAYQDAVCAQIEYYQSEGVLVALNGASGTDYTIGRISVRSGNSRTDDKAAGVSMICRQAKALLEQTGLLSRHIGVLPDIIL